MIVKEKDLPKEMNDFQSVEAAYPAELARCCNAITRKLSVLIECEKELVPYFYRCLRDRLKAGNIGSCAYLDGRQAQQSGMMPQSIVSTMLSQIKEVVRGAQEGVIAVLPHLDLLTTTSGGLTSEAKEVIPLVYENPNIIWVGFKDPSFPLPEVISNLFSHRESILGISRERLPHIVLQREARKFGRELNLLKLYKYVSGLHSVRLRHILAAVDGEDYPENPKHAFDQIRASTLCGKLHVPDIDIDRDVGGYTDIKERIKKEILAVIKHKETLVDADEIQRVESLIPKGMIFSGPPGTGKTLFAKAIATSLQAAVTVVSGPEIKSKWVGESEERIRQIFLQARQSAPSVIVFDEIDSFATARGTYTGSGVEHSMVNQLLTEMDGFRSNEMVFVIATTNFVESLDPALLRPGRFEFQLCIPYPGEEERKEIFNIYNKKMGLALNDETINYATQRTGGLVEGSGTRYSGDHIQALCRSIARRRIRGEISGDTSIKDVEDTFTEYKNLPALSENERKVVATHEAGHAICSLYLEHAPKIQRISIRGDIGGSLGYVAYTPGSNYLYSEHMLHDYICTLFGGRAAEAQLIGSISTGAAQDLQRATSMSASLCKELGLAGSIRSFVDVNGKDLPMSNELRSTLDSAIQRVLDTEYARATSILREHEKEVQALRDMLLEHGVLDCADVEKICSTPKK